MKNERESTIPVRNIGRCPVGICAEVHREEKRMERVEAKLNIVAAGVGAVILEIALLIFAVLRSAGQV